MTETPTVEVIPPQQEPADFAPVMLVYILYFMGFFIPLTAAAGVIVTHVKSDEPNPDLRSHYTYQMRTFWFGLAGLFIAGVLMWVMIGWVVFAAWYLWTLVRCVKGFLAAQEKKPIPDPLTLKW